MATPRSTPRSRCTAGTGGSLETPASGTRSFSSCTRAPDRVTIKWVQQDPLVMNGEPFCYGSRLTVRQLLELRSSGYDLPRILTDHPELRTVGRGCGVRLRGTTTAIATRNSSSKTARSGGPVTARLRRPACRSSTGSPGSSSRPSDLAADRRRSVAEEAIVRVLSHAVLRCSEPLGDPTVDDRHPNDRTDDRHPRRRRRAGCACPCLRS